MGLRTHTYTKVRLAAVNINWNSTRVFRAHELSCLEEPCSKGSFALMQIDGVVVIS